MRILNRAHVPWFLFVVLATLFACWVYIGNFHPQRLPASAQLPPRFVQTPSEHRSVGGTPLGLIFGAISFGIFIFAALLGVRKKIVLWRIGTVQRWLRAHIWLTLLTIPLVLLHSGFRFGGPMTTLLMVLYAVVMVSGIYGLILQHQMPHIMMERLPAETVFEQIPHIRAQLYAAAEKMRDSLKPTPPAKTDAGAPAPSPAKAVTAGSTPMASTASATSTPTARAKSVVGSTITAEPIVAPKPEAVATVADRGFATSSQTAEPKGPETMGTPTARVPEGTPVPAGTEPVTGVAPPTVKPSTLTPPTPVPASSPAAASPAAATTVAKPATPAPAKPAAPAPNPESEATLLEFLDRQVMPYLAAHRGERFRFNDARFCDETFRFVKLRVAEVYRSRVEEIQAWCDERRLLDLQTHLQHWLHGWLFIHVPFSFFLIMLTAWHAFVTLFYY